MQYPQVFAIDSSRVQPGSGLPGPRAAVLGEWPSRS